MVAGADDGGRQGRRCAHRRAPTAALLPARAFGGVTRRLPLFLAALWTGACGPPPAPPAASLEADDFLLGGIPARADTSEVRISFGDPDSVTAWPNPFAADSLRVWHYPGFEIRFSEGLPVGYLLLERGEQTARGLRVGDEARELRRRYGEPTTRADESWTYIEDAPGEAVRILDFLVRGDTIRRIYIGRTTL